MSNFRNAARRDASALENVKLFLREPLLHIYSWLGLDTDLMYAAHRAAGGMISVYRQIGIGCERLFRSVLFDTTGYSDPEFATWSYTTKTKSGKAKKLSLDGRIELSEIQNKAVLNKVKNWIQDYCADLGEVSDPGKGIVFEVR